MKRTKRVLASVLALTLTFSCALPAFAADPDLYTDYDAKTDLEGALAIVKGIADPLAEGERFSDDPTLSGKAKEYAGFIDAVYNPADDPFEVMKYIYKFQLVQFKYEEYKVTGRVNISKKYIDEEFNDQATMVMTKEDYADLTANPERYELYFIDGEAVLYRDGLLVELQRMQDDVDEGDTVEVTIAAAIDILNSMDQIFFAINTRNEALQQIEDFMTEHGYWNIVEDEIVIRPSFDRPFIYNAGSGSDTYKVSKGSGYVYIRDYCERNEGDAERLVFDYDTSDTHFTLRREDNDLYIFDVENETLVFLKDYFGTGRIEYIEFSPDVVLEYKDIIKLVNKIKGTSEDDELVGYTQSTVIWGEEGNDTITAEGGDEYYIHAGSGNNTITVSNGNDVIVGGDGNDTITISRERNRLFTADNPGYNVILSGKGDDTINTDGNNIIVAGQGDDIINSGFGDDVFVYYYGDGNDNIKDSVNAFSNGGTDIVYFADLTPDDVYVRHYRYGSFTFFVKGDKEGSVTIPGVYQNGASKYMEPIEYVAFSDGTVWNLHDYLEQSRYVEDSSEFTGYDTFGYTIIGTDGDDKYYTANGDDVIIPGKGNDYVNAGGGTDTFIFYRGDGHDKFDESNGGSYPASGEDTVLFADINSDEVYISRFSNVITIKVKDSDDAVELPGIYQSGLSGPLHPIEKAKFADGVEWTFLEMLEMACVEATDGNDSFIVPEENHVIYCGKGNDYIRGKEHDDLYIYNLGDGHDIIEDHSAWGRSYDEIHFGKGITPDMLCVKLFGNDVVISIPNTEDSIDLIKGEIELFTFEDGTSMEESELLAKAADHNYPEPECIWTKDGSGYSAKFVFVCSDCGAKIERIPVVDSEEDENGNIIYTAKLSFNGAEITKSLVKKVTPYRAPAISFDNGVKSVKLSWTQVEDADLYAICCYVSGKWQKIDEFKGTAYELNNLKANTDYKIAVFSRVNGKWKTDASNAVVVRPRSADSVSAYPEVTRFVSNGTYHQFKINWSKVKGASQYGVAVKVAGKWKVYAYTDANTTTFTSPKLKEGSKYEMVICAKVNGKWNTSNLNARAFTVTVS